MKKRVILSLTIFVIVLLLAEGALRVLGFKPGQVYKNEFIKEVTNLKNLNGYKTDSLGIFSMDTSFSKYLLDENQVENGDYVRQKELANLIATYSSLGSDFYKLRHGMINCSLAQKINSLKEKRVWSDLDSALIQYSELPLNKDGFFSIEFKKYQSSKPKILLIGDSFTWGHSTTNKALSFANELLAKDYIIYNTGVSGTDVAQYEAIAAHYIPKLEPDIVIVSFFMGNDISYYKREVTPFQPSFYPTNAGNLMAFQQGHYFSNPEDAYENVMQILKVPTDTKIRKLASKTVLSSLAWTIWMKLGMTNYPKTNEIIPMLEKPACNAELLNIKKLSEEHGAQFELITIPDFQYGKTDPKDFPYLFENIDYSISPITWDDYKKSDGHFNDEGHKKYAVYLESLIEKDYEID